MNERNVKRRKIRSKRKRRARRRKSCVRRKFQTNQTKVKRTSRLEETVLVIDTGHEMIHADAEVMPTTNVAAEMMVNDIEKTVKRTTCIEEGITTTEFEQKEIAEMEEEIGMIVQMLMKGNLTGK